jgi:deazaflavin-dependent oxidoreductase (nitroreductase family)
MEKIRARVLGLGARPAGVWLIKHVISPLDRAVVRLSKGRIRQPSALLVSTLLLTVAGRHSGVARTIPLIYVRGGTRLVVANARPASERPNPWVANLRAAGEAEIKLSGRSFEVVAHEMTDAQLATWWPELTSLWPPFEQHYVATGERTGFALEPRTSG